MCSVNLLLSRQGVLVRVSMAALQHHDQGVSWGGKGLLSLHFHIAVHHQRKSGLEPKQGRNLEAGVDAETMEVLLLPGLLPLACSACFLIELRTTSPGMILLTMVWALPL